MIKRAMQRSTQDKTVYTGYICVQTGGNPNLVLVGNHSGVFVVAETIPKWLGCDDKPYQDLLEYVDDSNRVVKLVLGKDGKPHPRWCVSRHGIEQIVNALFDCSFTCSQYLAEMDLCTATFLGENRIGNLEESNQTDKTTQPRYTVNEIMENPDILIGALNRLKEEQMKNRQLTAELTAQSEKLTELEPKAEYYDKVLNTANGVSPSVIAKEYGKSALWLNKLLHSLKIQYKQGETWVLYSRFVDKGYTCTKTHQYTDEYNVTRSVMHTYWTQAGRKFIYDVLKKRKRKINPRLPNN